MVLSVGQLLFAALPSHPHVLILPTTFGERCHYYLHFRNGKRGRERFRSLIKINTDLGESNFNQSASELHILQTTLCLHCHEQVIYVNIC